MPRRECRWPKEDDRSPLCQLIILKVEILSKRGHNWEKIFVGQFGFFRGQFIIFGVAHSTNYIYMLFVSLQSEKKVYTGIDLNMTHPSLHGG